MKLFRGLRGKMEKRKYGESLREYCLSMNMPQILEEWDDEKNAPLTPDDVSRGSKKKVWWRCKKGHEWEATLMDRSSGHGCHYCAGRLPWPGETDLATVHPELAAEWHPTRNGDLRPEQCLPGSERKVWWRCEKGHEWQAYIYSRSNGTGCPYCDGRRLIRGKNDLATLVPEIAKEWSPKNGDWKPSDVLPGSNQYAWWVCDRGHEWRARINSRVARGTGCPYCKNKSTLTGFNDLATTYPELAAEWHPTRNGKLRPEDCLPGAKKKVWWRCREGHEWQALVSTRTAGNGCPYCARKRAIRGENDLATLYPEMAKEWSQKNGDWKPSDVLPGSNRYAWWVCGRGHEWRAMINARVHYQTGCPYCGNKKLLTGFNDLATVHPELAAEWHPTLNGDLTPDRVITGNYRKVWWRCKFGHVWKAGIISRCSKVKCGCPVCAGTVRKKWRKELDRKPQVSESQLEDRGRFSV